MSNFREFDRETGFLLPPSLDEWLPEQHLARFVVEVIDGLDLSAMVKSYRAPAACFYPVLLLGLLVYGYATGVFSSRKLERATYDLVAFRFIAVNEHPDHDTIATFRRRFLKYIVWPSLRRRAPRSKRAPRNASSGRRLSIAPSWRRGRRRLRMARREAAGHPHRRSRGRSPRTRST